MNKKKPKLILGIVIVAVIIYLSPKYSRKIAGIADKILKIDYILYTKIAIYILVAFIVCFILFKFMLFCFRRARLAGTGMEQIDKMTGEDFERYLAMLYRKRGYDVKLTKATMDFGADLLISENDVTYAVQAKRYSGSVPEAAVQQAISAREYYHCDRAVVITNSRFTPAAERLAQETGVQLIDRNKLRKGNIDL